VQSFRVIVLTMGEIQTAEFVQGSYL